MKALQDRVRSFCEENNLSCSTEFRLMDVISELGELAKEVLKESRYGETSFSPTKDFEQELGDLQFSILALSVHSEIDLERATIQAMEKYKSRLKERGTAGSS